MLERTLLILKPDAVQRALIGTILKRIENKGLKIVALKMLRVNTSLAEKLYKIHEDKKFYRDLVNYICSGPIVAVVVEGARVIEVTRKMIGSTDAISAEPGTIRGDLAMDVQKNVIHASDSKSRAEFEIALFFKPSEIVDYQKIDNAWLY